MTSPPVARRDDIVDILHGVEVPDPYRWLEVTDDPEVRAWVAGQGDHARQHLAARPDHERWHERLMAIMEQPTITQAQLRGDRIVTLEREAGADQACLAVRSLSEPGQTARIIVDPTAGGDPTGAIDWYEVSDDGTLVAYGASVGGTERSTLRVIDTSNGEILEDEIPETRACSVAWEADGSGFFYTRYPAGDEYHRTVHHHRLGTDWADDPAVWADHPIPEAWPMVELSPDGDWLLVHVQVGWSRVDVHLHDRRADRWVTLIQDVDAETIFTFGPRGDTLVGMTTLDASSGRLVIVPLADASTSATNPREWRTIVPERDAVLGFPQVVGDEVWVVATESGVDRVERWTLGGDQLGALDDLGVISVLALATDRRTGTGLILVHGFDAPPTMWWAEEGSDAVTRWWTGDSRPDLPQITVRRVVYPSLDGTEIGLFLIHRADVQPDGETPTILSGYGGFAIAESPVWSPHIVAWCEAGGLFAVAGLRGGVEHGEAWHLAGNRANKQNVFDDFAAAGDWLVDQGLTSRDRLAILGRSNGGLLVGATLTQRPDLCRAVWCGVPLLDMIRFPQFLIARLWTSEYGDPDVPEEYAWLHAYSPYHHVEPRTCYPATLLTCAEGDSRVHPLHARKMAAQLQHATACADERPILFIEEGPAGHGVGKPVSLRAAELADALTFLSWQLSDGRRVTFPPSGPSITRPLAAAPGDRASQADPAAPTSSQ